MPDTVRVFRAARIITMNPALPFATHVAVRDGRILAVGDAATMAGLGAVDTDDRFAAKTLLPGFVEGHSHLHEGAAWRDPYLGFFDRRAPDGSIAPGLKSIQAVVERLRQLTPPATGNAAPSPPGASTRSISADGAWWRPTWTRWRPTGRWW